MYTKYRFNFAIFLVFKRFYTRIHKSYKKLNYYNSITEDSKFSEKAPKPLDTKCNLW